MVLKNFSLKRYIFLIGFLICLWCMFVPKEVEAADAEKITQNTTVEIHLKGGKSEAVALENFKTMKNVLATADGVHTLTVKIENWGSGKFYVGGSGGGALLLRSHTTLDLNRTTLVRGGSAMGNFLQNVNMDGTKEGNAYSLTNNLVIKNGTIDGIGGTTQATNLINFGHASGIVFQDLLLKNSRAHLVELSGCENVTFTNCDFDSFIGEVEITATGEIEGGEAVQLDICNSTIGYKSWNGVYANGIGNDSTPCKNIVFSKCDFLNYPSGIGNHHTITNHHSSQITIKNCNFKNQKNGAKIPAIQAYAFDNCVIENNVINGIYSSGIYAYGGSYTIRSNKIAGDFTNAICLTKTINNYVFGKIRVTRKESVVNTMISSNIITVKGDNGIGIIVAYGSVATKINGNKINVKKGLGIRVSGNQTSVTDISSNTISVTGKGSADGYDGRGISVSADGSVTQIVSNTISAKGNGIQVSSRGYVNRIGLNKGTVTKDLIYVSGNAIVNSIYSHKQYYSKKGHGIEIAKGTVNYIYNNNFNLLKSSNTKGTGIFLRNGSVVQSIFTNTISTYVNGINVSDKSKVTTQIYKNTITARNYGVLTKTNSIVYAVRSNKIAGCKKAGVFVSGKSKKKTSRCTAYTTGSLKNSFYSCKKTYLQGKNGILIKR